MGEGTFLKESSLPPHPYLQRIPKQSYIFGLHSAFKFYSVCHPERSVAKSNFCEVQRSKRAKAQGEAAAGSIMNFCYLSLTNVTFISKKTTKLVSRSLRRYCSSVCSVRFTQLRKLRLRSASLRMTRAGALRKDEPFWGI